MLLLIRLKLEKKKRGQRGSNGTKNLEIMVPLKLIINFWRSFKMSLINCKNNFDLNWSETCVTLLTAINADLTEKSGTLKIKKNLKFF